MAVDQTPNEAVDKAANHVVQHGAVDKATN